MQWHENNIPKPISYRYTHLYWLITCHWRRHRMDILSRKYFSYSLSRVSVENWKTKKKKSFNNRRRKFFRFFLHSRAIFRLLHCTSSRRNLKGWKIKWFNNYDWGYHETSEKRSSESEMRLCLRFSRFLYIYRMPLDDFKEVLSLS